MLKTMLPSEVSTADSIEGAYVRVHSAHVRQVNFCQITT